MERSKERHKVREYQIGLRTGRDGKTGRDGRKRRDGTNEEGGSGRNCQGGKKRSNEGCRGTDGRMVGKEEPTALVGNDR